MAKIKSWWSDDQQWFCILVDDGVNKATVSLTHDEAQQLAVSAGGETLSTVLALLNPLHGSLDEQTYDEKVKENFDAPPDAEYAVNVTAKMERDLTQAVCIIENRLRTKPLPDLMAIHDRTMAALASA